MSHACAFALYENNCAHIQCRTFDAISYAFEWNTKDAQNLKLLVWSRNYDPDPDIKSKKLYSKMRDGTHKIHRRCTVWVWFVVSSHAV